MLKAYIELGGFFAIVLALVGLAMPLYARHKTWMPPAAVCCVICAALIGYSLRDHNGKRVPEWAMLESSALNKQLVAQSAGLNATIDSVVCSPEKTDPYIDPKDNSALDTYVYACNVKLNRVAKPFAFKTAFQSSDNGDWLLSGAGIATLNFSAVQQPSGPKFGVYVEESLASTEEAAKTIKTVLTRIEQSRQYSEATASRMTAGAATDKDFDEVMRKNKQSWAN